MDFETSIIPNILDNQALEDYEQCTFEADSRIFHQDAWTSKVPRDRANVTLSALVKEFNLTTKKGSLGTSGRVFK